MADHLHHSSIPLDQKELKEKVEEEEEEDEEEEKKYEYMTKFKHTYH